MGEGDGSVLSKLSSVSTSFIVSVGSALTGSAFSPQPVNKNRLVAMSNADVNNFLYIASNLLGDKAPSTQQPSSGSGSGGGTTTTPSSGGSGGGTPPAGDEACFASGSFYTYVCNCLLVCCPVKTSSSARTYSTGSPFG